MHEVKIVEWRSPLSTCEPIQSDFVSIAEASPRGILGLRGDLTNFDFLFEVKGILGFEIPDKPNSTVVGELASALWLGPDEWLIITSPHDQFKIEESLRRNLVSSGASIVDLTESRAVIKISGNKVRDVLAKGCPLDLHPRMFMPGVCKQSVIAKASIILHNIEVDEAFEIYVGSSYAKYLWSWLHDATREF